MRVLVAGASTEKVCGVRDCARALEPPLHAAGVETTLLWLDDPRALTAAVGREAPGHDAVLWHYSPFTYASRGIPTLVPQMSRALRRAPVPTVVFLHELAPRVRGRGWRGAAQAVTQRAALVPLLRAVDAAIVTSESRAAELRHRLLPRRRVTFIPLVSNIEPVAVHARGGNGAQRIGVFGFRHSTLDAQLAANAVARSGGELVLVGAPGADGEHADRWRSAAARAGVPVEFTGVLETNELSHALASLDVLLSPDPAGPEPRRGTLSAALAHGLPVVALDGPARWQRLTAESALVVADDGGFAPALVRLASDASLRHEQGKRARAFYERWLAPDVVALQIRDVLAGVTR